MNELTLIKKIASYNKFESYNKIVLNPNFVNLNNKSLFITSSIKKEDKTFVLVNMARTLTKLNKKVLVIDVDLRRTKLSYYYEGEKNKVLNDYLLGDCDKKDIIYKTDEELLNIIPAKQIEEALPLLLKDRLKTLIDSAKKDYDYVILDCAPFDLYADANVLAKVTEASLLVAKAFRVTKDVFKDTDLKMKNLKETGNKYLGVILVDGE